MMNDDGRMNKNNVHPKEIWRNGVKADIKNCGMHICRNKLRKKIKRATGHKLSLLNSYVCKIALEAFLQNIYCSRQLLVIIVCRKSSKKISGNYRSQTSYNQISFSMLNHMVTRYTTSLNEKMWH